MFYREDTFGPSVAAIQRHLGAVEKELEKIGRVAGRRTSVAASAAGDQIGDAISSVLSDMFDRFRRGGQMAHERASSFSNRAIGLGANYGNNALEQVSTKVEERPFIAIGVALGLGILIGLAVLNSRNGNR
jgi:ElaB/YqjD/DUF883 family membrane-anchored ribosome-binding protein